MPALLPGTRPIQEHLTQQVYEWEMWGRGWVLNESPVQLEPPFAPFPGHTLPDHTFVDDGVRNTVLSSVAQAFLSLFKGKESQRIKSASDTEDRMPDFVSEDRRLIEFSIAFPGEDTPSIQTVAQMMGAFIHCREPLAFEIVATVQDITIQFAAEESDARIVTQQLKAHFPNALISQARSSLRDRWTGTVGEEMIVQFGLDREFFLPLRSYSDLDADVLTSLCGGWDLLSEGELGIFQVLFQPARKPWVPSIWSALTTSNGKPFFENAPHILSLAEKKVSHTLHAVTIRLAVKADDQQRSRELFRSAAGALNILSDPMGNRLIALRDEGYGLEEHMEDLLNRVSRRFGMLMNTDELASLVHFPGTSVQAINLVRRLKQTKAVPPSCRGPGIVLGINEHENEGQEARLTVEQRLRHVHVIGNSGTGKSTLLLNLICQDINANNGVAVLDPHGDLIDDIVPLIPPERWNDVILFDAADEEYPIGFNILSAHSELEKTLLASDLVDIFRRLSTSFGDQMRSILGNAILAFLESDKGGTLADLRRFLIEPAFRKESVKNIKDPEIVYYWEHEFPLLKTHSLGPLLTRLDEFLRRKTIRHIVGQRENKLDFRTILDGRQIFLGRLPQGLIGEENSFMLGSLLVSKFHQLAISRQEKDKKERPPFFLYLDEFHHFVTPTLETILSGGRKYGLGLTLAHQGVHQLEQAGGTGQAVLSLSGSRVCFRVGDSDARKLADGFANFEQTTLQDLDNFEAICRVDRREQDFNLRTLKPREPGQDSQGRRDQLRHQTRVNYGTPRNIVEAEIAKSRHIRIDADLVDPFKNRTRSAQRQQAAEPASDDQARQTEPSPTAPTDQDAAPQPASPDSRVSSNETLREHESIKREIEREAELLDYAVFLEKEVLNGKGRIDVVLERGEAKIACEISVTTTIDHEVQNVAKCAEAGYQEIFIICTSKRRLSHIRRRVEQRWEEANRPTVLFHTPVDFLSLLRERTPLEPTPTKSHKQGINLLSGSLPDAERKMREQQMLRELTERMKRSRSQKPQQN